jgi:hypothetical protein
VVWPLGEVASLRANELEARGQERERGKRRGEGTRKWRPADRRTLILDFGYASPLCCLVDLRKRRDFGNSSAVFFLAEFGSRFARLGFLGTPMF